MQYHLPYTVLNLHLANKAFTEVPELISEDLNYSYTLPGVD